MRPFPRNTNARLIHNAASVEMHMSASLSFQKPESTNLIPMDQGMVEENHARLSQTVTLIGTGDEWRVLPANL